MKLSFRAIPLIWLVFACSTFVVSPRPVAAKNSQPAREIYAALNALRVDSTQIYSVNELRLRKDSVSLIFSTGTMGLLQTFDGRITGVVFSGRGHVTAIPSDRAEKQSLVHFQGLPLLDRDFTKAYLRFDDGSDDEIVADLRRGNTAQNQPEFANDWNTTVANLNPDLSARLLLDEKTEKPSPFFYAELLEDQLGTFDVLVDSREVDSVMIGQRRYGGNTSYDVWAAFAGSGAAPPPPSFAPTSYAIETSIAADRSITGITTIAVLASRNGETAIPLQLSRFLKVESAEDTDGNALDFFQTEALGVDQLGNPGDNKLLVFLPQEARAGVSYNIRLIYRGNVLGENRGSWYPRFGAMSHFAPYDLQFRWPGKLALVASGDKVEEREDGEWRIGRWHAETPIALAGFNLGDFKIENGGEVEGVKMEVAVANVTKGETGSPAPSPAAAGPDAAMNAKALSVELAKAIRAQRAWLGPFPSHALAISETPSVIAGNLPGIIFLPTLLPSTSSQASGPGIAAETSRNSLPLYRELARQSWGGQVGWDSYRDEWVAEGLANYVALVAADSEQPASHILSDTLSSYQAALAAIVSKQDYPVNEAGPLSLGARLRSSPDSDAYSTVMDGKGAWIFHMLRMMMKDPASTKPDERFTKLLRDLLEAHRHRALTTENLQKAVEKVMPPSMAVEGGHSMDWFFDEYVQASGIPEYDVEFSSNSSAKGFLVRGKLIQKNVPDDFVLRVPIYSQSGAKQTLLGYVVTSGEETAFQFVAAAKPEKLLIDPQRNFLCSQISKAPAN